MENLQLSKKKRTFLINQSADLYPTKYQKIN